MRDIGTAFQHGAHSVRICSLVRADSVAQRNVCLSAGWQSPYFHAERSISGYRKNAAVVMAIRMLEALDIICNIIKHIFCDLICGVIIIAIFSGMRAHGLHILIPFEPGLQRLAESIHGECLLIIY